MDGENQAYRDVPNAKSICDEVKTYFKNFGVEDYDTFELMNPTSLQCEQTYG